MTSQDYPRKRADVHVTVPIVITVATVAAYVSYQHAHQLVYTHGEDTVSACMYPITIDGLIFSASMVMLRANRAGSRAPFMAWVALTVGIMATLAANLAHGIEHGPVGMMVSAWPAVALVLSFEMLMRLFRPLTKGNAPAIVTHAEPTARPHDDRFTRGLRIYSKSVMGGNPLSQSALAKEIGMRNTSVARAIIAEYGTAVAS